MKQMVINLSQRHLMALDSRDQIGRNWDACLPAVGSHRGMRRQIEARWRNPASLITMMGGNL